jgi:hypothetical protein
VTTTQRRASPNAWRMTPHYTRIGGATIKLIRMDVSIGGLVDPPIDGVVTRASASPLEHRFPTLGSPMMPTTSACPAINDVAPDRTPVTAVFDL